MASFLARRFVLPLLFSIAGGASAGLLDTPTVTRVLNLGASRPGIGIGGIYFDGVAHELFAVGATDFNTPAADLFQFDATGKFLSEHLVPGTGGMTLTGMAAVSHTQNFYIISRDIAEVTRTGEIVRSQGLPLGSLAAPAAAVAVNPRTGNLWVAVSAGDTDYLAELNQHFDLLRKVSYRPVLPNPNDGVLGLDIDPATGNFIAALEDRVVEISADMTSVVSQFTVNTPGFSSLTSVSLDSLLNRLYVSSGTSDRVFEVALTPIPEPSAMLLIVLGLGAVLVFSRRGTTQTCSRRS